MKVDSSARLSTVRVGRDALIRASGDLDLAVAQALDVAVRSAARTNVRRCVLDCRHVTFIDSEIVKTLLALRSVLAENGVRLELRNPSRQVRRVLELLGLDLRLEHP